MRTNKELINKEINLTDNNEMETIRVSTSIKSLFVLMITDILRGAKYPLTVNEIIKRMKFMYAHIIISDDEIDVNTIQRYMTDLSNAQYLSFTIYSIKGANKMENRYGIRENSNISKIPDDFAKNSRMKPAGIYDFLYRNMYEPFTASEIAKGLGNKVSIKTVRDTLIENECYTDCDNFEAMRIYSDEFRSDSGKWVTKFWCEPNVKTAAYAS